LNKKKLLVVSQHYYPENFRINDIVAGFTEDGYAVDVLCGMPNYPEGEWFPGYSGKGPKYEEHEGVRVFRSGEIRRKNNTSLRIFLNYVSWPISAFFRILRLKGDYDAVFCYNTSPVIMCFPAIRASRKFRAPLTTYVLDLWPENLYSVLNVTLRPLRSLARCVSNWHYNRADKLIAISESLKERLRERVKDKTKPIYVVPQHAEDFYTGQIPNKELEESFAGKTVILFAGNFSPAQNLEGVIRAVAKAQSRGFEDIHLLLLGSGMSQTSIENTIKEEKAEQFVTLYGRVDAQEIPRFTTVADVTIVSLAALEDFKLAVPAKVASSMAAGKPIIASLDGEGAQAITAAECGFVAPAGDEDALCDCLLRFKQLDASSREELGKNAADYYKNHYARKTIIKKLAEVILT